jgi:hypothetical protein
MADLTDLGFLKGVIAETVVSTYSDDGQPNAAPMGAIMDSLQRIVIRIYTSSLTYKNLQRKRCAVINVTSNAELFFRTAFKEANPDGEMPLEWFEKAETVDAPRLRMADAFIEVNVVKISPLDAERAEAICKVKLIKAQKVLPKVYCRALFATIEAIIHATRIKPFLAGDERERKQALKLLKKIEICQDTVKHAAPNSPYSEIMSDLTRMIDSWRRVKGESVR